MELQLIELYLWVCSVYDKHPMLKYQRLSNNWKANFTDQELITVYLFGQLQGYFKQTRIHEYMVQHFKGWFPDLPAYQTFNYRLNHLSEPLKVIVFALLTQINESCNYHFEEDCLIDSMPIMLAVRGRSYRAKVAVEVATQSYCASKDIWYHARQTARFSKKTISKTAETGNVENNGGNRTRFAGFTGVFRGNNWKRVC